MKASTQLVGSIPTFSSIVGLEFGTNGQMYACTFNGHLYTVDPQTAQSNLVFTLPETFSGDLASFDATTLFATVTGPGGDHLIKIDPLLQTYVDLGEIASGNAFQALDFDGQGNLIALSQLGDFYRIPSFQTSAAGVLVSSTFEGALGGMTSVLGACPSIATYCTAGTTSLGCTATISGTGTPSASATSGFTVTVSGSEAQKQSILFYGIDNTGFTPLPWGTGGTSFLCVKPPTQRTPVQNSGGTLGQCNGTFAIDWNAYVSANPSALGAPFASGQPVYVQGWFRDPPSPKTTSLSNGLSFVVCP
jgi:hypothetical protein